MLRFLAITIIGLALTCFICCEKYVNDRLSTDEFAIYLELAKSSPSRDIFIFSDPIIAIGLTKPEQIQSMFPTATETVSADFLAKNRETVIVEKDILLDGGFVVIASKDTEKRLKEAPRWNSFSRVGFDSTKKTALVWYSDGCAGLCGEAGLFLLQHNGQKWVIVAEAAKIKR